MRRRAARLLVAPALAAAGLAWLATPGPAQNRVIVRMVAERFAFSPSEITVTAGTTVEFRIRSEDTNHGFRIVGQGVEVEVPKRGRGEVTAIFEAREPGRYTFECSKLCGAGHDFMRGLIIVKQGTTEAPAPPRPVEGPPR